MTYAILIKVLEAYLAQEISRQNFEDWIAEHLQGILDSGDFRAIEAANRLQVIFAEISEGLADDRHLQREAYNSVSPQGILLQLTTGQTNRTISEEHQLDSMPQMNINLQFASAGAGI